MIGRLLDQLIDQAIVAAGQGARTAARLGDHLLNSAAPVDHRGADLLAEAEADCEVFEPLGEYPEVPARPSRQVRRQVALDAVCEILAEHHPNVLPSNGEIRCRCGDYLADRMDWREHVAPGSSCKTSPDSAPGATSYSVPVAADAPSPASPPRDAGSGHSTSDLLTAAANQITAYKRGVTDPYLGDYLAELIPELRDRAAQFEAVND